MCVSKYLKKIEKDVVTLFTCRMLMPYPHLLLNSHLKTHTGFSFTAQSLGKKYIVIIIIKRSWLKQCC